MVKNFMMIGGLWAVMMACNDNSVTKVEKKGEEQSAVTEKSTDESGTRRKFRGELTGGFKRDSIFFEVNAAGTKLENLYFKGYWRCDGKLESEPAAGPQGAFDISNNHVDSHISEPPNGGSSAWRFDLTADINGKKASGTFRMNINGLGCNTGMLKWEAGAY